MDGQALQRWNTIHQASEMGWQAHAQQNYADTHHKLMYWQNAPPVRRPPPQASPPQQMVDRNPRSDTYRAACRTAQKRHDTRLKAKNKALKANGAQTTRYVRDRVPKKQVVIMDRANGTSRKSSK